MMPPASAKDMLMQVKRYADGGDVSSAGLAKAMSSGLTQTQYDDNIRAYIAKTANPLDALNAASENGVSMADINRALGTKAASDYFTTDYNTETAPSTNVATGFTSKVAQAYNAPGAQGQSALDKRIGEIGQQYADNTSANAQILRDMFIQEGGSIADLQRAGFDPSRLLGTVAKKPVVPPVTPVVPPVTPIPTPYTQTQPTYTAPTVYQPLPEPPPIYAAGQPALDVAFRNSAPRTYDPVYGYTYSPAAKLLSATGAGMSFTPPSVTSRPRDLLKVPLPTAANPQLSASQVYARDLQAKQQLAALPGGRFAGQTAPISPLEEASKVNPNAITPTEFRFYAPPPVGMQSGGPVKKPEGTADNSDRAPVASPKTADQYADVFGEMDNIDKLSSLLKGGYLGAKYLLSSPNQYLEHGRYPDVIREKLQQEYWDLGTERVDAGPLDAALNYAGAYDWAVRPDVDPEDARKMAEAYQLRYYIDPNRVPQNEVADYHRNMAGIEAGVRDRALNKRLSDAELMAEAVAYAADQTGTSVPRTRSQTYADIVRETPPEAKSRDANPTNTPKGSYLPGLQDGGYVTRKQDGEPVAPPMSNADLLAQIDRSTANSPAPATGTASSAPDREVTESRNMLERFTSLNTPQDMSLGETAADIAMGFAPIIGTAQGLRDFERARRDDDTLGMVLGAASALPIVGGAVKAARTVGKASKAADDLADLTAKAPTNVAPNLTRFLENSQVKEPVFHAAKADVQEFSPKYKTELSSMGFHFGTADQANFRTNQYDFDSKSPNIGKYYLNIENPLEVSHMASFAPDHLAEKMMDMDLLTEDAYDALSAKHDYDAIATGDSLVKILKKNGYDGLKYKNEREGDGFSFVPFNPTQIKSAIGNVGTFDPTNPAITKAQGGYVTKKTKGAKP